MSKISIVDLEVFYHVGVPDAERAQPQRLLLTIEMTHDITSAAVSDRVDKTIDYFAVAQYLLHYGDGRSWNLLEKLVTNIAADLLAEFKPAAVTVEVKKFIIPQAKYVSVTFARSRR
jgi:dihydroneopterin aldolase